MYCSECGEKLIAPNQKFCHNCGTKVPVRPKATNYNIDPIQKETISNVYYVPVKSQMQLRKGKPGKYSNLCFWLALGSLVIGIISFSIGYFYNYMSMYIYYESIAFEKIMERVAISVVLLFLRIGGLIMGISSRVSAIKAQNLEPYNDTEKAGSILMIFGILINSVGLFMSFLGPWAIFRIPTYYID